MKIGPQQKIKALRKYSKAVPKSLIEAAQNWEDYALLAASAVSGSVPAVLDDLFGELYLRPITVGKTTLQLDFDTGSPNLWVYSSLQASDQLIGHDYYKVDDSKVLSGYSWEIDYLDDGNASGKVCVDKVTIGGVTATSQQTCQQSIQIKLINQAGQNI